MTERPGVRPHTPGKARRSSLNGLLVAVALVVATTLVVVSLVLPAIAGRRERPLWDKCPGNLKQIAYACALYSADNVSSFPPHLRSLYPEYISDTDIIAHCGTHVPVERYLPELPGAIIDRDLCYCYVSGLMATDDPGYILAFDEEWNHKGEGVRTVRIGGRISWESDVEALHKQLTGQEAELKAEGRTMIIVRPSWSIWPARPVWVKPRSRFWWVAGGSATGVLLLAAAVATLILLRRRRRRLAAALADIR
ncbi:MAG: hypothetical protein ACYS9X_23140 [Planctomycetota bacterium]